GGGSVMNPTPAQVRFWNWFKDNGDRLAALLVGPEHNIREEAMEELSAAAREVEEGLVLEVAAADETGMKSLVVSADGKYQMVAAVKDFVGAAPTIPGWHVVAFRSRVDVSGFSIHLQDEKVSADDVRFVVREGENGLDLILHVRGLTPKNRKLRGLG